MQIRRENATRICKQQLFNDNKLGTSMKNIPGTTLLKLRATINWPYEVGEIISVGEGNLYEVIKRNLSAFPYFLYELEEILSEDALCIAMDHYNFLRKYNLV